jgi:hypothetical protein
MKKRNAMSRDNKKKSEPWRIIVFIIAAAFIIYMWVKKDIVEIYKTMPSDQVAPLIITTVAVSLFKVAAIAGAILLIKWIVGKTVKK